MRKLSNEQKKMQGTYQECRDKPVVQWQQMDAIPDPPDFFNEVGATTWYSVCHQLKGRGELCFVYMPLVDTYCFAVQMWSRAKQELMKEGAKLTTTYINKVGASNEVPSAWFRIMKQSEDTMRSSGAKLGLSPLDIQKLPEPRADDGDYSLIKEPSRFK